MGLSTPPPRVRASKDPSLCTDLTRPPPTCHPSILLNRGTRAPSSLPTETAPLLPRPSRVRGRQKQPPMPSRTPAVKMGSLLRFRCSRKHTVIVDLWTLGQRHVRDRWSERPATRGQPGEAGWRQHEPERNLCDPAMVRLDGGRHSIAATCQAGQKLLGSQPACHFERWTLHSLKGSPRCI